MTKMEKIIIIKIIIIIRNYEQYGMKGRGSESKLAQKASAIENNVEIEQKGRIFEDMFE